jgi:1-deoxy-D-xylulose-5-phosphate reductoisomerase
LDVIRAFPEMFEVIGLASGRVSYEFYRQMAELRPKYFHLRDQRDQTFDDSLQLSLTDLVTHDGVDLVVVATPGGAGIGPTVAALRAGKPVALANKEALVAAGSLATTAARDSGAPILPIDSEHSAIWQCLQDAFTCVPPCIPLLEEAVSQVEAGNPYLPDSFRRQSAVRRLILTASGGAFRDWPVEQIPEASAADALKHPNWSMGPKVTIDSATLMNKGFELIEAHWLFGIPFDQLDVLIHRESIVHSLVEFADASIKAQLGLPDMRLPIQYALTFPDRLQNPALPRLDLAAIGSLTFESPREERYPCLSLAVKAGKAGGTYPSVLGGADEVAVELFMAGEIAFGDISALISDALDAHQPDNNPDIESILRADEWARAFVQAAAAR